MKAIAVPSRPLDLSWIPEAKRPALAKNFFELAATDSDPQRAERRRRFARALAESSAPAER